MPILYSHAGNRAAAVGFSRARTSHFTTQPVPFMLLTTRRPWVPTAVYNQFHNSTTSFTNTTFPDRMPVAMSPIWSRYPITPLQPVVETPVPETPAPSRKAPPSPPQHYVHRQDSLPPAHFGDIGTSLHAPEPDLHITIPPQVQTLANAQNYQPIAITGSDGSYFIDDAPATFPQELSLTNPTRATWQLPSNILHQLGGAEVQHPTNPVQRALTIWGIFTCMNMHNSAGFLTHRERVDHPMCNQNFEPRTRYPTMACSPTNHTWLSTSHTHTHTLTRLFDRTHTRRIYNQPPTSMWSPEIGLQQQQMSTDKQRRTDK